MQKYWDPGHPYRWRTWIRVHLPWFLIDLGVAAKVPTVRALAASTGGTAETMYPAPVITARSYGLVSCGSNL